MAQVWLVTGSSRGLGRAIVEAGIAAGNKVLATARDIESLRDLSKRYPDQVNLFALDVTDESAAAGAAKTAIAGFGSLDVVINNAGYGNLLPVEDTPMSKPTSLGRSSGRRQLFGTFAKGRQVVSFSFLDGRKDRGSRARALFGCEMGCRRFLRSIVARSGTARH
jgi:NAD(P)-dependent dehydrogenase (short-subunit alcohol dehydrogenase family)